MKNLFISNLNEKDVQKFTTDRGLRIRRKSDKGFKKLCRIFTKANIIMLNNGESKSDEEYLKTLQRDYIPATNYDIKDNKNNIIVERYPKLNEDEPYIFVGNHTCPEDIETILNVLDRNTYLILGSIESLRTNPEMYLSFLNGMIPFDIMDKKEREGLMPKMERVLKTNSILIFPEGSHNYSPNNLINPIYDGPVNLSLRTDRKIVIVTMIKDHEKNIAYMDVSNPIDLRNTGINKENYQDEKSYVNSLSLVIRDKMASSAYALMERHIPRIKRTEADNIEEKLRSKYIEDAFEKLKWSKDIFEAEYLTKKPHEYRKHEDVINTLSGLCINTKALDNISNRYWIKKKIDIDNKDVVIRMRRHLEDTNKKKK